MRRAATIACLLVLGAMTAPAAAPAALSVSAPAARTWSATLNGTNRTATYNLPLTVQDSGTAPTAGWNLTIGETQYTGGGRTLPTPVSQVTAVTTTCTSCTVNPTNSVGLPVALPVTPGTIKFYNAAASTGLGSFTIRPTITVTVPADAFAGSYTATVTTAIVSGP